MKSRSNNNLFSLNKRTAAFTFVEVVMAVTIIGIISATVLVVMNRCMAATIDSRLKMQAFELIRENMENLLASDSATEMAEFGTSENNPDIRWETVVETFSEPVTSNMWLQAVCSAYYNDSSGEEQTIELTHWLGDIPKNMQEKINKQRRKEMEYLDNLEPGLYSKEQIEYLADFTGISIATADSLLSYMNMTEAIETVLLSKRTGLSLSEAYAAIGMSPDKAAAYVSGTMGISPEKASDIIDKAVKDADSVPPPPDPEVMPEITPSESPDGSGDELTVDYWLRKLGTKK